MALHVQHAVMRKVDVLRDLQRMRVLHVDQSARAVAQVDHALLVAKLLVQPM
jgi:hypothetical protein